MLVKRGYGQLIRDDGPKNHLTKRGTPTMGGIVIVLSTLIAYGATKLATQHWPSASALLVLFLMTGLGGVGFVDDFIKIYKQRSLGLRAKAKMIGQALVAVVFAILVLHFPDQYGQTPASTSVSFLQDTALVLGPVLFVVWAYFLISGWSNAVNLTDGLDGLATGASAMVFAAYVLIGVWQYGQSCVNAPQAGCYEVRDPLDLAIVAAALMGACFGFLWWNAAPAKIIMGDTGSLAIGAGLAAVCLLLNLDLLLLIIGGLFVMETLSVILQVISFRAFHRRIFRMAPIHHHFELGGWPETTVIVRFWILGGLFVALALGIFYGDFLTVAKFT
jgi:phospho-N-acetylmuramoyl-pentapeptide-transferase